LVRRGGCFRMARRRVCYDLSLYKRKKRKKKYEVEINKNKRGEQCNRRKEPKAKPKYQKRANPASRHPTIPVPPDYATVGVKIASAKTIKNRGTRRKPQNKQSRKSARTSQSTNEAPTPIPNEYKFARIVYRYIGARAPFQIQKSRIRIQGLTGKT